ncbi:MAG: Formylglycine-generating enzyme, required for sulfatase activity, contains SUMF1/FGE domain [Candidatus Kentron sp. G]|nr:MAG: Formylglycine-generating enzyme, required for sulfatase activity, contains SUMF1/FGE domain [Candidatus Kentron sp. G]VFM96464.1 MAG: Formylglycine-generating enzyme, required for sulfatase activity, contains SUMF1/FGE domain [Candidatus Kentron sp. G]VFM98892.1 MAG: Formylglycine-generating enzyme, required for sulfatase activity, contains SUMF1/FGE domain [Candidatus Kentron sp. G]
MHSLRFRPLLLAYIDHIIEAGAREWTPYTLYEALVESWLAREEEKLRRRMANPPSRKTLWRVCATVALELQQRGERLLSRAELDGLAGGFPALANLERFDVGGRSLLNCNADGDFRFSHYSIQEFLVAHALVNGLAPQESHGGIRVTDQLLAFLSASDGITSALLERLDFGEEGIEFASLERLDFGESLGRPMPELHFYDRLSDGSPGPRMQFIPAGEFLMGSPKGEGYSYERPQHRVWIDAPFALGTYPVTFAEYGRFCAATDRTEPTDEGWGRGQRPVINVSWRDARDYCAWLSKETGHDYHLPSEAEWEYAARAGTQTDYWWGDGIEENRANCVGCGSQWGNKRTAPVGSFVPNPFGLYDTAGNVREWTADCWHRNYQGAPVGGSAWLEENGGDCSRRVLRGGSWVNGPWFIRSAFRSRISPDLADDNTGFRVARAI